jgi:mRNA deadenylase 3'-5' endonuclease subunit Ccr4
MAVGVEESRLPFSVASYNVLASAYVQRAWYRRSPLIVLDPAWRVPALVQHISNLGADILCLQEVEPEMFVALRTSLSERGYGAEYGRKSAGRPEGCALLYRREAFELMSVRAVIYTDGDGALPDTGDIALVALFQYGDNVLGMINTHLIWDPPATPRPAQRSLRQAQQLVAEYQRSAAEARGWIIGGDFNVTPFSEIVSVMKQADFRYAHDGLDGVFTCNVGASARMIDYLFYSPSLHAAPMAPTRIDNQTVLPSAEQPSDHVAIMATFDWNS